MAEVQSIRCPNCGGSVSGAGVVTCPYCGSPLEVKTADGGANPPCFFENLPGVEIERDTVDIPFQPQVLFSHLEGGTSRDAPRGGRRHRRRRAPYAGRHQPRGPGFVHVLLYDRRPSIPGEGGSGRQCAIHNHRHEAVHGVGRLPEADGAAGGGNRNHRGLHLDRPGAGEPHAGLLRLEYAERGGPVGNIRLRYGRLNAARGPGAGASGTRPNLRIVSRRLGRK
jgi:hypothetical protein